MRDGWICLPHATSSNLISQLHRFKPRLDARLALQQPVHSFTAHKARGKRPIQLVASILDVHTRSMTNSDRRNNTQTEKPPKRLTEMNKIYIQGWRTRKKETAKRFTLSSGLSSEPL